MVKSEESRRRGLAVGRVGARGQWVLPLWLLIGSLMLLLSVLWRPLQAAVLETPAGQSLAPGQHLQLPLQIRQGEGPRIEIRLGVAPAGASLILDDDGRLLLDWMAGPDLAEETQIELLVRDVDTDEYLDSVFVAIRRGGLAAPDPEPSPEPEGIDGDEPGLGSKAASDPDSVADEPALEMPQFDVLANQVVSAGRAVTLRVSASLTGEVNAVLQVDRLPRRASFDANDDGSRTFRWQTQEDDQGEHLFRFTAFNPRAPLQRVRQEVLIIVGDPTLNVTLPEPLPEPPPEVPPTPRAEQ